MRIKAKVLDDIQYLYVDDVFKDIISIDVVFDTYHKCHYYLHFNSDRMTTYEISREDFERLHQMGIYYKSNESETKNEIITNPLYGIEI